MVKDTRQNLIDQTREMIDQQGLDSVSLRELGKQVALSRSAVYRYFDSKDALLGAIALEDIKMLHVRFTAVTNAVDEPKQAFHGMLYELYRFGIHHHDRYALIFNKKWEGDAYQTFHALAFELYEHLQSCIEKYRLTHAGVKSSKELTAMASAFTVGLIEIHYADHLESKKGLDDQDALFASFIDLLLN